MYSQRIPFTPDRNASKLGWTGQLILSMNVQASGDQEFEMSGEITNSKGKTQALMIRTTKQAEKVVEELKRFLKNLKWIGRS